MTREDWLQRAAALLKEQLFDPREYHLPPILRVSVGLCPGKSIGICIDPDCAEDGSTNLFIDPKLTKPVEILATLLHEMVHASVGNEHKHKGPFVEVIHALGLEGKPSATYASPETELYATLQGISVTLGEFPHAALIRKKKDPKKPHSWQSFVAIGHEDEYVIRANINTVEQFGPPVDPWGQAMVLKEAAIAGADDEKLGIKLIVKPSEDT